MKNPSGVPDASVPDVSARRRGDVAAGAGRGGGGASHDEKTTVASWLKRCDELADDINGRAQWLLDGNEPTDDVDREILREMRGLSRTNKRYIRRIADPLDLSGRRLVAYEVLLAAGERGLTSKEYERKYVEALPPALHTALDAVKHRSQSIWHPHRSLRDNASQLGLVIEGEKGGRWRLRFAECASPVIVPPKKKRTKPK